MKRWLARLALIGLGLVLALFAAEALLQAGAAVVRWSGHELPAAWRPSTRRIVALGDSNTYGLWVQREESYPQVLEDRLGEEGEPAAATVLNLGFPGNNSSTVRQALPRVLRELRPDLVTVMIGTNDWWTAPARDPEAASTPSPADWLSRHSRVYRLLFMIGRSLRAPDESVVIRPGPGADSESGAVAVGGAVFEWQWRRQHGGVPGWQDLLRENLRAMAALCRAADVGLVFLTYPAEVRTYGLANAILREEAAATGTPLIDLAAAFRRVCPAPPCEEWFFLDNHPTPRGYRLVAEEIAAGIQSFDR